jgi:hypothetical protein
MAVILRQAGDAKNHPVVAAFGDFLLDDYWYSIK